MCDLSLLLKWIDLQYCGGSSGDAIDAFVQEAESDFGERAADLRHC